MKNPIRVNEQVLKLKANWLCHYNRNTCIQLNKRTGNESVARARAFEVAEREQGSEALRDGLGRVEQSVAEKLHHLRWWLKAGRGAVFVQWTHDFALWALSLMALLICVCQQAPPFLRLRVFVCLSVWPEPDAHAPNWRRRWRVEKDGQPSPITQTKQSGPAQPNKNKINWTFNKNSINILFWALNCKIT